MFCSRQSIFYRTLTQISTAVLRPPSAVLTSPQTRTPLANALTPDRFLSYPPHFLVLHLQFPRYPSIFQLTASISTTQSTPYAPNSPLHPSRPAHPAIHPSTLSRTVTARPTLDTLAYTPGKHSSRISFTSHLNLSLSLNPNLTPRPLASPPASHWDRSRARAVSIGQGRGYGQ